LEDEIDREKADNRDIFEYGISFVVDGIDARDIRDILSNIIAQEKDENVRLLKTIQQEAAIMIQQNTNPGLMLAMLNSYTDIPIKQDEVLVKYWSD
jgi:hypothetical protein